MHDISKLCEGVAQKIFEREFKKVVENIKDYSTDSKKTRKIVLEFVVNPNQDRQSIELSVKGSSKLAPHVDDLAFRMPVDDLSNPKSLKSDANKLVENVLSFKQNGGK